MGQLISSAFKVYNDHRMVTSVPYSDYANYGPQAETVPNATSSENSPIYRMSHMSAEELQAAQDQLSGDHALSCVSIMQRLCQERQNRVCIGYRRLLRIEKKTVKDKKGKDKVLEVYILEPKRSTLSYAQFWSHVCAFGRGLRQLGLQPGDRVAIYEETRWEWLATVFACWTQQLVVVTVYANLGNDALRYALKEAECVAIVCNGSSVPLIEQFVQQGDLSQLRIIYLDKRPGESGQSPSSRPSSHSRSKRKTDDHAGNNDNNNDRSALRQTSSPSASLATEPKSTNENNGSVHLSEANSDQAALPKVHADADADASATIPTVLCAWEEVRRWGSTARPVGATEPARKLHPDHTHHRPSSRSNPYLIANDDANESESEKHDLSATSGTSPTSHEKTSFCPVYIPRTEDDTRRTALIMYTSGTTGNPKGVVHTHRSLCAGVLYISQRVEDILGPLNDHKSASNEEWYCSYLPLAHIMELCVTCVLLRRGVYIGYGRPRTLMNQFARPHGDLQEYKPKLFVAVPRVFESMRQAAEERLPPVGSIRRRIFDNAYRARLAALRAGKDTPFYNRTVFRAARAVLGGNVYAMLCGGGPLTAQTQEFVTVVFGLLVQGWGLTETACCGTIQRVGHLEFDTVGQLIQGVEMWLKDTENYTHKDQPEPRGELCLRGAFLFQEYYKQPELTREALDEEGWFHTGDVGSVAANGTIRIVGRSKSLVKNAHGEYIALEPLESVYGSNALFAANAVCVLVDPHRSFIALIGSVNHDTVEKFMRGEGLHGEFPAVLTEEEFRARVLASVQATARKAGRRSFEMVKYVHLVPDEWNAQNGLLTAAMKLKRAAVEERYKSVIEEIFSQDR